MSSSDVLMCQELCAYVLTNLLATLFDQNVTVVCLYEHYRWTFVVARLMEPLRCVRTYDFVASAASLVTGRA